MSSSRRANLWEEYEDQPKANHKLTSREKSMARQSNSDDRKTGKLRKSSRKRMEDYE